MNKGVSIGIKKLAISSGFYLFLYSGKKCLTQPNTGLTMTSVFSGIKHLKSQSDSAFPEEEEGVSEREEEWGH